MQQIRDKSDSEKLAGKEGSNGRKDEVNEVISDISAALTVSDLNFYYGNGLLQ